MRIKTIFYLGIAVMGAAVLLVAGALVYSTSSLHQAALKVEDAVESLRLAEEIQIRFLELNRESLSYRMTQEQEHKGRVVELKSQLGSLLANMEDYARQAEERALFAKAESAIQNYLEMLDGMPSDPEPASRRFNQAIERIQALVSYETDRSGHLRREIAFHDQVANYFGLAALVVFIGIFLAGMRKGTGGGYGLGLVVGIGRFGACEGPVFYVAFLMGHERLGTFGGGGRSPGAGGLGSCRSLSHQPAGHWVDRGGFWNQRAGACRKRAVDLSGPARLGVGKRHRQ